MHTLQTDIV